MSNLAVRITASLCAALLALVGWSATASAQQDEPKRVMVLPFDTMDVDEEVTQRLSSRIEESLKEHPTKQLVSGGEISLNDMIVTVGCEGATPECLSQLSDFVEADQLLFGSVQRSEDVHLFTLRLFDFETSSFEAEIVDQTVDGDADRVKQAIPALIDGLFYGDVGQMTIAVEGADTYEVFVDGESVGDGSTTIEGLALGEHVVMTRAQSGEEQTQQVLVERGEAAEVAFRFSDKATPVRGEAGGNRLLVPGVGLVVAGLTGLGYGTAQYLAYRRESERFNDLTVCTNPQATSPSDPECRIALRDGSPAQVEEVRALEGREMKRSRAMLGWGVGGALTVLGGSLIHLGGRATESADASSAASSAALRDRVDFTVITTRGGYRGVQLDARF